MADQGLMQQERPCRLSNQLVPEHASTKRTRDSRNDQVSGGSLEWGVVCGTGWPSFREGDPGSPTESNTTRGYDEPNFDAAPEKEHEKKDSDTKNGNKERHKKGRNVKEELGETPRRSERIAKLEEARKAKELKKVQDKENSTFLRDQHVQDLGVSMTKRRRMH